ncbi:MAG: TIGR03435 family protein [Terracidiphilus sp.]
MAPSPFASASIRCVLVLAGVGFCLAAPAPSQTSTVPQRAGAPPLAYDIVSIKPYHPKGPYASWWRTNPDGMSANVDVQSLIMGAYNLVMPDQISGLPGWAESTQYVVEAKMDADTMAAFNRLSKEERSKQSDQMMQAILAERFSLKIHHELKQLPVYQLVIAKGGPTLKESPSGAPMGYSVYSGRIKGQGIAIQSLAYSLSGTVGRLIVDKTGLTGKYDIDLKWSMDDAPAASDPNPSIFTALQEQLGLKLESTRAPVDTIVIEHLDKPSEN